MNKDYLKVSNLEGYTQLVDLKSITSLTHEENHYFINLIDGNRIEIYEIEFNSFIKYFEDNHNVITFLK